MRSKVRKRMRRAGLNRQEHKYTAVSDPKDTYNCDETAVVAVTVHFFQPVGGRAHRISFFSGLAKERNKFRRGDVAVLKGQPGVMHKENSA